MQKTWIWSLGQEELLEKEMETHSCIPAWEIPPTEGPDGLQSMGSPRVRHTEQLTLSHLDSSYVYLKKDEVDFIFKWVQTTKSDDLANADIFWNLVSWIIHSLLQRDDEVKLKKVNSMSS